MDQTREVPLHQAQLDFISSPAIYRGFVGGRGSGKTRAGVYDLLSRIHPGRTYLVASPTSIIMTDTTFPTLKAVAEQWGVWASATTSPYPTVMIRVGDGLATVRFRTAEDPEKLRGPNLSGVWLDEASLMGSSDDSRAYDICIAALREAGEQGWLSATFTPKGPNHWTHDVFAKGASNTAIFRSRTGDNPFNPVGFEQTLQQQYGDGEFARQELGGEFVSMTGAEFPPEWFDWPGFWFEQWPEEAVFKVLFLDPSKGVSDFAGDVKTRMKGDYQAYVLAALVREVCADGTRRNALYLDAQLNRENTTDMIARGLRIAKDWRPSAIYFEDNGTMGFMAPEVKRQALAADVLVPWFPVTHRVPKIQRIRVLGGYLAMHQIRIRATPGGRLLRAQLGDLPFGDYDDGPDAAAGAAEALGALLAGA